MKEVLGSLPEVITAYKNYNLLVPTATDVQLNPFYKFHVEEVPVDLGENSGDIFKVGSVKTGKQDEKGKDIWEDVFSLSKPLLNKMAMAAGIQFNPKETYGERIDRVTYRAQAQGAMRKADGTARTETDQKVICLEDEEEKYRIEFADKATKGITDEKQAQAAAEIFSGQWVESKNKWGKKCQAFVVAKLRNEQIDSRISLLSSSVPTDLEYRLEELNRKKEELDSQQEKRYRASIADHELQQIRSSYSKQISDAKNKRDYHQTRLREIKQQEEFMKNSGCPDIENASCRFLAKAVDDVKNLPVERGCLQKFEKEIETLTSEMNKKVAEKQKEIWEIGYNPDQLKLLLIQVNGLAKYERIKKDAEQNKLEIARLEAEKESNDKNIGQCEKNLLQVKLKASEITETVNKLSESVDRQEQIKQQMAHLQTYVEQEKELPVYEERKQHVLERIESMEKEMEKLTDRKFILSSQLTGMDTMIEKMREPPFLDDEGAQAYVDALETIRDRYSDVKIMAITHDDAMKARFGQAVTVIKTDDGSKVIY